MAVVMCSIGTALPIALQMGKVIHLRANCNADIVDYLLDFVIAVVSVSMHYIDLDEEIIYVSKLFVYEAS